MADSQDRRSRPDRGDSPGRRRTDLPFRDVASKRLLVFTVVVVNAIYLAGDAILRGQSICP
jgi:hypothetical protein